MSQHSKKWIIKKWIISNKISSHQVSVGGKTYEVEVDANYSTLYEDGVTRDPVLNSYFIKSIDPWPLDFDECDAVERATRDALYETPEGREAEKLGFCIIEKWEPYDGIF